LLIAVTAFTVMYVAMMVKRIELARLEDAVLVAEQASGGVVAGAAVTAPTIERGTA
jgi:hypothetical protein